MSASLKNLLLISITLLLVSMGGVAKAQQTNYDFNSTTYTLNIFNGTWSQFQSAKPDYSNSAITPWWGNQSTAESFALGVGTNLGPNTDGVYGPLFVFLDTGTTIIAADYNPYSLSAGSASGWSQSTNFNWAYVSSSSPSGVVPEMNASLIPQVGLLLGCLFFLMGRKKEVVEPILAA
jgi:hypothetical protein